MYGLGCVAIPNPSPNPSAALDPQKKNPCPGIARQGVIVTSILAKIQDYVCSPVLVSKGRGGHVAKHPGKISGKSGR